MGRLSELEFQDYMVQCPRRWVRSACLVIAATGLLLLIFGAERRGASKSAGLNIRIDTNGLATVLGIPLGNSYGRDIALRTLGQTKVPVTVLVPSGGSSTRAWDTNFGATMNAIIKAGLIPTNKASGPSPYE
jgi:hypothetical protein